MDNETKLTLKACRVNCGLTIKEVAKHMNKTEKTIQNWETGKSIPDLSNLKTLSMLYRIPVNFIFLGTKSALRGFQNGIRNYL